MMTTTRKINTAMNIVIARDDDADDVHKNDYDDTNIDNNDERLLYFYIANHKNDHDDINIDNNDERLLYFYIANHKNDHDDINIDNNDERLLYLYIANHKNDHDDINIDNNDERLLYLRPCICLTESLEQEQSAYRFNLILLSTRRFSIFNLYLQNVTLNHLINQLKYVCLTVSNSNSVGMWLSVQYQDHRIKVLQ